MPGVASGTLVTVVNGAIASARIGSSVRRSGSRSCSIATASLSSNVPAVSDSSAFSAGFSASGWRSAMKAAKRDMRVTRRVGVSAMVIGAMLTLLASPENDVLVLVVGTEVILQVFPDERRPQLVRDV